MGLGEWETDSCLEGWFDRKNALNAFKGGFS